MLACNTLYLPEGASPRRRHFRIARRAPRARVLYDFTARMHEDDIVYIHQRAQRAGIALKTKFSPLVDIKQNSYWLLQQCCKNTGYETKQLLAPTAVLQKYRIRNKTVTGSYSSVAKIQDTKQNSYWLLQQCCKNTGYETKQLLAPTAVLQKYRIRNKTVTGSYSSVAKIQDTKQNSYWLLQQ